MKYNKLGTSDIEVSRICLGTMTFGEQNSQEDGFEQMDYAISKGVNFIDTAEMYSVPGNAKTQGSTETIVGNWLEKSGKRKDIVLATKVVGKALQYIREGNKFDRKNIYQAIESSLGRLKTDYIDLYQLHWPERKCNIFGTRHFPYEDDQWQDNLAELSTVMNDLIKEGKIREWGLSNESPWGTMRFFNECDKAGLKRPVTTQNSYSLVNRAYENGMSEVTYREGIGLLAYSPLAFGSLTGKYLNGEKPEGARMTKFPIFSRYLNPILQEAVGAYKELAEDNGMSVVQLALAFVNSRGFVSSNIIGATKMSQLKKNIDSINIEYSGEVEKAIFELNNRFPDPGL